MVYLLVLVLFASIALGRSYPYRNYGYEGDFGYDPYHGSFLDFPDQFGANNEYVPVVEGRPIYIPEGNVDHAPLDMTNRNNFKHARSKHSWDGRSGTQSRRIIHRNLYANGGGNRNVFRGYHPRRHERDYPTREYSNYFNPNEGQSEDSGILMASNYRSNYKNIPNMYNEYESPVEQIKPGIEDYAYYGGPEIPVVVEDLTPERPVTEVQPVNPEDDYDIPVVVEALTLKENPVAHEKPVAHLQLVSAEDDSKENPTSEAIPTIPDPEFEIPVVVEALIKKNLTRGESVISNEGNQRTVNTESPIKNPEIADDDTNDGIDSSNEDKIAEKSFFGLADGGSGDKPEGRNFLPVDPNIWSLMSNIHTQERHNFKKCLTPSNETGNCMPIQICSVPNVAGSIDELLKNVCVIDEVFIGICCPEFPVETVRVDWEQFQEEQHSETFNENDPQMGKECGKLPTTVGQNIAWPWMANLIAVSTGKEFCGGALINEHYVLSAAHCTTRIPRNRILVRLAPLVSQNSSNEDFAVVQIKRHANYNPRTMENDIALLKLSKPVTLGESRRLVCLPSDDDDQDYNGETAIILHGWQGFSERSDLESLRVISNQECQDKMGVVINDSVLCTEPRTTDDTKCNDDSGAPLVIGQDKHFKVIGILTWNRNDCDERFPSLFIRVSSYRRWIDNHAI